MDWSCTKVGWGRLCPLKAQRGLDDDYHTDHNIRTAKGTNQNCPFSSRTLCTSYYSRQTTCSEWSKQNFQPRQESGFYLYLFASDLLNFLIEILLA